MPTVEQNMTNEALKQVEGQPVEDEDVELLVRAGIKLLSGGGIEVISKAINQSHDPAQVIGQFMAQLIMKMGEEFVEQMQIDPRAFLAKGGFLEELLDYIEERLSLPSDFSDQIYAETVEMIKAVVKQPEPPSQGGQPLEGAPAQGPMPPQGMPPQGPAGPPPLDQMPQGGM